MLPILRRFDKPGNNRVEVDIPTEVAEVPVGLDELRFEISLLKRIRR
jgi:hypothetical protein